MTEKLDLSDNCLIFIDQIYRSWGMESRITENELLSWKFHAEGKNHTVLADKQVSSI